MLPMDTKTQNARPLILPVMIPLPVEHGFAVCMLTIVGLLAVGIIWQMFFTRSDRELF